MFLRWRIRRRLMKSGRRIDTRDRKSSACLVLHFINTTTFVVSIFGSGEARRGSIPRSGAVTEEQRSQNRKSTQPAGRRCFSPQTLLLTPYRPMKGMRVARFSSGPEIPRHKRGCIYEAEYLAWRLNSRIEQCSGRGVRRLDNIEPIPRLQGLSVKGFC